MMMMMMMTMTTTVRTLFQTKHSRTLKGLSRTHFAFFKDSIQCKKEPWIFSPSTTWAILSRKYFCGCNPFPLVWITLAPKFKDFPAKTAIFKDCQEAYELWTMTMMPTTITITNNDDDYVFKRLFSLMWSWSGYVHFLEPKSICLRRVQSPQDILVQYQHGRCLNDLYTNMATVTWCENDLLSSKDKNSHHHLQITYIKNRWKIRKLQCTFSSSIYNV